MKVLLLLIAMVVLSDIAFAQKVHTKTRKDKKKVMLCGDEKKADNATVSVEGYTQDKIASGKESKKVRKNDYKNFFKRRQKSSAERHRKTAGTNEKPHRQSKKQNGSANP